MKIAVCIRRTPSTETKVNVAGDGRSLDPSGVSFVLNPYDEYAVEEALRTKEAHGGEVVVVTVGPADTLKELKQCLAMGADRAIRIEPPAEVDSAGIAAALVPVLKELAPDLIFCGKMAVDEQDFQVPLRVATALELPAVSFVVRFALADGKAVVDAETEAGVMVLEAPLPALFAVEKGINEPRYPGIKGIMAAKKKPVDTHPASAAPARCVVDRLELPPVKQGGKIVGEGVAAVPELVRLLREEAKAL
ncbi:MAG: electron transfer flavoprotein subunit beta/FixA family protein [Planctomycetes bacterium]|nr:electron transfer flavoprotein subunit beta/FixA family protein [Planctomycetota bacterium]